MNIEILKMTADTVSQVAQLEDECFSKPWSESALAEELNNLTAYFITAIHNQKVVGYVGMHCIMGEGYITNVAVKTEYRSKGVGSLLIQSLKEYASQNSFEFITLEVRKSNIAAINLYTKQGFKDVGERKNFYREPKENAVLMTWLCN